MKKELIQQGNRLMAEFMGVPIVAATSEALPRNSYSRRFKTFEQCQDFCDDINRGNDRKYIPIHESGEMKYHESWDWLIPVCRKFDEEGLGDLKLSNIPKYVNLADQMDHLAGCYELELLYEHVIKCLEWYNKYIKILNS